MSPHRASRPPRPPKSRRWTSFVADAAFSGRLSRGLHEESNPRHRVRVEHTAATLLIHLSDEEGAGWMTIAVDRRTRQHAVGRGVRQLDAAGEAFEGLYGG